MSSFTKLTYMEDQNKLQDTASVLDVQTLETGKTAVILDKTIFYPQGGGQPYDTGVIKGPLGEFKVEEVRFKDGIVYHIGQGIVGKGESVTVLVDEPRRTLNRRNHTAGHLIDVAVKNLGYSLMPVKGFHFPDGAYVEYEGSIDEAKREELRVKIEQEVNNIIQKKLPVVARFVTFDELKTLCDFVPEYLPKDKPVRIVKIGEYAAHPCGGTHVNNTADIKGMKIEKVKNKGGNTRISYRIA